MLRSIFTFTCLSLCAMTLYAAEPSIKKNNNSTPTTTPSFDLAEDEYQVVEVPIEAIQQFIKVYQTVQQNYVKELNDEQLFASAMQGLVKQDAYSRYLNAEDYRELIHYTEGGQATVEFNLTKVNNQWVIENLRDNSSAAKAGLKNGLVVRKIDNKNLNDLTQEQVQNLLTGALGSVVNLQLGLTTRPIKVTRSKAEDTEVSSRVINSQVLYIKVPVFKQETANEIKNAIQDVAHLPIQAILIDLRNNPGGLLSSAVETSELFLKEGLIVTTKSRAEGNQSFRVLSKSTFTHKLGIIINAQSASAAEVFSSAMQQNQRAYIMGEKSYGKGVVQKILPLDNGDAVSLTVAHYYTPDGQQLDGKGIEPHFISPRLELSDDEYINQLAEVLIQYQPKNK